MSIFKEDDLAELEVKKETMEFLINWKKKIDAKQMALYTAIEDLNEDIKRLSEETNPK